MTSLLLKTLPTAEPVTLAEAKAHLRVDHADEDTIIQTYLAAARSRVEAKIRCALMPTVYQYKLDGFPAVITLPVGPVLSGTNSVTYVDDAGASQTLSSGLYQFTTGDIGRLAPSYGNTWPTTYAQMDAVTVEFTAGWTAAANIPPAIKAAVLLALGALYEHREDMTAGAAMELPVGAHNLLLPFVRDS